MFSEGMEVPKPQRKIKEKTPSTTPTESPPLMNKRPYIEKEHVVKERQITYAF